MSTWKVSKEEIVLFPHPDAEKLELGKIGSYQVVVQKGLYVDGDVVVFAPEKSLLTGLLEQEYKNYLAGPEKNRVKGIRLRNEFSAGIIIPPSLLTEYDLTAYAIGEDISEVLGITKYEAPIPVHLAGEITHIEALYYTKHDCEQIGVYLDQLIPNERIVATEKIHGSQVIIYKNPETKFVTSKGYFNKEQAIKESDSNGYWRGVKSTQIFEKIEEFYPTNKVQIFGELVPCQSLKYGFTDPVVKIFNIFVDGQAIPYDQVPESFKEVWVPVLYDGPFIDLKHLKELSVGNETVSGQELHIREGVVVSPYIDRYANDGTKMKLKVINPAYKETGEEIS